MRKREWLCCSDPVTMLHEVWGQSNQRRLRLFALVAGQRLWAGLDSSACRLAIESAWQLAEETTACETTAVPFDDALRDEYLEACGAGSWEKAELVNIVGHLFRNPAEAAWKLLTPVRIIAMETPPTLLNTSEMNASCRLMRDIFGDRGRVPPLDSTWLTWNDGAIRKLAQVLYDDRAFDRLPLLADALEDAGCSDADILTHCRGGGEHARGCWVVDLLLGKT